MTHSDSRANQDSSDHPVAAMRDRDDLGRSEQALRERERLLDSLIGFLPGSAYRALADEHWTALFISKGIEDVTGYPPDEFTSGRLNYNDIMLPEDRSATREAVVIALRERRVYDVEHRIRHKDGSVRWIWARGHGVFAPNGSLRFIEGWNLDITGRKQAEERLRESEQRWRGLTEALPQLVWSATPGGACDYFSTQWTQYTGLPESDLLGWRWLEVLHPHDREPTRQLWTDSVAGGGPYEVEYRVRRSDGEYRWFKTRGVPIRDGAGNIFKWLGTCTDVTTSKQVEEELRHVNARLDLAVRGSNVGVWDLELADGDYNRRRRYYVNVWEQLGYDGPPAGRESALDEADPDDRAHLEETVRRYLAGETTEFETEIRLRHKDGSYRPTLARGAAMRDAAGKPIRMVGVVIDITDLKRVEEALRESEERFRGTFENAAVGIAHCDLHGRYLRVNQKYCEIVGYSHAEMLSRKFQDVTHPDDLATSLNKFKPLLRGELPSYSEEKRLIRKDGSLAWVNVSVSLQADATGGPIHSIGIVQDISERKRLEEALRASEERFRLLVKSIPQKIFTANAKGDVDYFNQQWTEFTGLSFDQIKDWGWLQFIHPDDVEENVRSWQHSIDSGEPFQLEHRFRRGDGVYRWHLSRALAMRDADGRVLMWFGSNTDIDDQKRAAEAFKQAKEAAEAANRAKDEFLANVSHEIRTPMNAILGMTELALDTLLSEDQRQYLTTVQSAADALLGVINDILDFAKIEAGRLELDRADFLLSDVLGSTMRALAVRAHKKGLELVCQQQPRVPDALIGDAGRLRQVLLNLVGNAIKFTERGEIVVTVGLQIADCRLQIENPEQEQSSANLQSKICNLKFEVRDTGIGIPPEKQAKIFQAFEQEDTSTTRKYGGTGLGLTIAARLVAVMGGEISVDSMPGRGSTFAFTARFGLQPHPPETTAASPPAVLRGLPVLVVDDNATNRRILEEWLRGSAMEPTAAGDGVTAMASLWRGVAQGRPYPLALLDGRMPGIDGLALAAKIREQAELSATRIILLTSADRPGDLTRARQLGISANLLKPLQQRELMDTILRVMGHQGDPEGLAVSPAVMRPPIPEGLVGVPLRILAAEDNEFNRDLLEHMLARLGLSAAMAINGREALALLGIRNQRSEVGGQKSEVSEDHGVFTPISDRRPLTSDFDLLLLDIHMPELDGFQVVGAIRERERTVGGHLPVIALTARSRNEDRERCLQAGMDDYLAKPFNAADLWTAIGRVLPRRDEGRGMRDEGNRTILASSLVPAPSSLINAPVLLAACGADPTMLRKMCRTLQSRVPEHLAEVRDALHDQDALRLREAAHKFCGMLSAFSTVAGDQAASLEDLAARGRLKEAVPAVEQLDHCATELARLAGRLTIETLWQQAEPADTP